MASVIDDFGAKIGGARKDLRGNFRREDVRGMTHIERQKLVSKAMVWPTPDYEELLRQGYARQAALMVKMLRDALPSEPIVGRRVDEAQFAELCELYVEAINAAKAVAESAKTPAELAEAVKQNPSFNRHLVTIKADGSRVSFTPAGIASSASGFDYPFRVRQHIVNAVMNFVGGGVDYRTRRLISKNPDWPAGTSQSEAWIRKQRLGVMLDAKPQQGRRVGWVLSIGGHAAYDYYDPDHYRTRLPFGELLDKVWATQEEASAALNNCAEGVFDKKRAEAKAKRDALLVEANGAAPTAATATDIYRHGRDWRQGVAATGELYLKHFRVRGGEFGLWVNQTERQLVLDRGYDALRDLALLFGWDRSAISLGGTLAIAFGSRGRGGANAAAAHYEASRNVINLTKPHGAGCLAHEWGHALDHYLGERAHKLGLVAGTTSSGNYDGEGMFLSNILLRPAAAGEGPEHGFLRNVRGAMEQIWTRENTISKESMVAAARSRVEACVAQLRNTFDQVANYLETSVLPKNDVPQSRHAEIRRQTVEILMPLLDPNALHNVGIEGQCVASIRRLTGGKGTLSWAERNLAYYRQRLREANLRLHEYERPGWEPVAQRLSTAYARQCGELDTSRSKPYYATRHEMFARAFETVVYDSIESRGERSSFLVSSTNGKAFPVGDERKVVTAALHSALQQVAQYLPKVVGEADEAVLEPIATVTERNAVQVAPEPEANTPGEEATSPEPPVDRSATKPAGGNDAGESTAQAARRLLDTIKPFISDKQLAVMADLAQESSEAEFFAAKLVELATLVPTIPGTYQSAKDPIVYLHYFTPDRDFYVTERDAGADGDRPEDAQTQAFGVKVFRGQKPRLGSINIPELLAQGGELDLHWTPAAYSAIEAKLQLQPDMPPLPVAKKAATNAITR